MKTILIDNGHGIETPGKRSPDGSLMEWQWTRRAAALLRDRLLRIGIPAVLLVPEESDLPLRDRVKRANDLCTPDGKILISLHVNASGMGQSWAEPNGWGAYVAQNASQDSCLLASALARSARNHGLRLRQPHPAQLYWVQNLAICRDTRCPAVLTENMFMDNLADCAFLMSNQGMDAIVDIHTSAITDLLCVK